MNQRTSTILFVMGMVWLAVGAPTAAGTNVGGFIASDTHWTQAGSPYVVQDSIAVIAGATLTIDPGVEVRFEPDLALTVDSGALVARGTQGSPIRFTPNQGPANRWGYIQFSDGAVDAAFDTGGEYVSGSILEHATVEYAGSTSTDYAVRAIDSRPYICDSNVHDNARGGIYVYGSGASSTCLEDNTIHANTTGYAVLVSTAPSAQLSGNTISDNTGGGVYIYSSPSSTLTDNTITGNTGLSAGGGVNLSSSGSSTLTDNTITGNSASTGGGVHIYSSASSTLTDNTITGNIASSGGGVYLRYSGSCTLANNRITENTGEHQGGGLYVYASDDVSLTGDRITGNHANVAGGAGGIYIATGANRMNLTGPDDANSPHLSVHLYGNDGYQFYNNNAFGGSFGYTDPGNADARYVFWRTTDPNEIEAGIYDFFDNAAKGVVFYNPFSVPVFADVNGDGNVDNLDITPFIAALTNDEADFNTLYPDGQHWAADCHEDGNVDNLDITPFLAAIVGGGDAVPEPATLWVFGAVVPLVLRRRVKR